MNPTIQHPSIQLDAVQAYGLRALIEKAQTAQADVNRAMVILGGVDGVVYNLVGDSLVPDPAAAPIQENP